MFGIDGWTLALTMGALVVIAALYIDATEPRPKPPVSKPARVEDAVLMSVPPPVKRYSACDRFGHLPSVLSPFCVDCGERIRPNDPDEAA